MKLIRPMAVNDAAFVSSNVAESDGSAGAWSVVTAYTVGQTVRYVIANVHQVYECLVNNTGVAPPSDTAKWLLLGATNRWKMFDGAINSQTTNANSIAVVLTANGRVNSIALFNLSAASVRIVMTDPIDGVVYDETVSLVSLGGITSWYAWYFDPVARKSIFTVTGLPPYANAQIAITLTDTGSTVACGECVLGLAKEIGGLQYGAKVGIQDFSVKQVDDFGNFSVLERAYAKRGTFLVWVESSFTDALAELLATYRSTPIVYIGDGGLTSTVIYGFYEDFEIEIAYEQVSLCSIQIEGLT